MDVTAVLAELGRQTGLGQLGLDAEKRCTLCFDGVHNITFEHDAEDHALLVYGIVGSSAGLRTVGDYRALLEASLLGAQTGGAAFGVHAATEELVLWKRLGDEFADYAVFATALNDFLAQFANWKKKIPEMERAAKADPVNMKAAAAGPVLAPPLGMRV